MITIHGIAHPIATLGAYGALGLLVWLVTFAKPAPANRLPKPYPNKGAWG